MTEDEMGQEFRNKLGLRTSNLITISPVTNSCSACNREFFDFTLANEKKIYEISCLFCEILNIDIHSIPSTNPDLTVQLPFCADCLLTMSELLQLNLQLSSIQSSFSTLKAFLVSTVLESARTVNETDKIPNAIVRHIHKKIKTSVALIDSSGWCGKFRQGLNEENSQLRVERSPPPYRNSKPNIYESNDKNQHSAIETISIDTESDDNQCAADFENVLINSNSQDSAEISSFPLENVEVKVEGESDPLWDAFSIVNQDHLELPILSDECHESKSTSFLPESLNNLAGGSSWSLSNIHKAWRNPNPVTYKNKKSPTVVTNDKVYETTALLNHEQNHHSAQYNEFTRETTGDSDDIIMTHRTQRCSLCFKFTLIGLDEKHKCGNRTSSAIIQCGYCDLVLLNELLLSQHLRKHLNRGVTPVCSLCRRRFSSLPNLERHMKMHESQTSFSCQQCRKYFPNESSLFQHNMLVHRSKEKRFHCQFCAKGFRLKNDLLRHTRIHTGEKPYVCSYCSKRFNRVHHLKSHLKIHTVGRYTSRSNLTTCEPVTKCFEF